MTGPDSFYRRDLHTCPYRYGSGQKWHQETYGTRCREYAELEWRLPRGERQKAG